MQNTTKTLLCLLLSIIVVLSMAACGVGEVAAEEIPENIIRADLQEYLSSFVGADATITALRYHQSNISGTEKLVASDATYHVGGADHTAAFSMTYVLENGTWVLNGMKAQMDEATTEENQSQVPKVGPWLGIWSSADGKTTDSTSEYHNCYVCLFENGTAIRYGYRNMDVGDWTANEQSKITVIFNQNYYDYPGDGWERSDNMDIMSFVMEDHKLVVSEATQNSEFLRRGTYHPANYTEAYEKCFNKIEQIRIWVLDKAEQDLLNGYTAVVAKLFGGLEDVIYRRLLETVSDAEKLEQEESVWRVRTQESVGAAGEEQEDVLSATYSQNSKSIKLTKERIKQLLPEAVTEETVQNQSENQGGLLPETVEEEPVQEQTEEQGLMKLEEVTWKHLAQKTVPDEHTELKTSDQVSLVAAVEEKDIYLYCLNNGQPWGGQGVILKYGEAFQTYPLWCLVKYGYPILECYDLDADGAEEIVCIMGRSGGTGMYIEDLYVFEPDAQGYICVPLATTEIDALVNEQVAFDFLNNNSLQARFQNGSEIIVSAAQDETLLLDHIQYNVQAGVITLSTSVQVIKEEGQWLYLCDYRDNPAIDTSKCAAAEFVYTIEAEVVYNGKTFLLSDLYIKEAV